jgi:hypothetical protein
MDHRLAAALPERENTSCNSWRSCGLVDDDLGELSGPLGDETAPCDDLDTVALVDKAVADLAAFWSPASRADAGAVLSCLVFLVFEAESRLWDAVADARHQGYTWDEIADRLGKSAHSVQERYGGYTRWRNSSGPTHA